MAFQTLPCGCTENDAIYDTHHTTATEIQERGSSGDASRYPEGRHYPIGAGPATFCFRCDLYRPCLCPGDRQRG